MFIQRSFNAKSGEVNKKWHIVDAQGLVVGRLATEVARVLMGKTKPQYTPYEDTGDFVVVVNAEKVVFTGKKLDKKEYFWHSNHIGGIKRRTAREQLAKHPELIVYEAVKGMLPKNTLGRKQLTKLKVVIGSQHPFTAQAPSTLKV
jgi:large subunit ribosomal protein L13